MNGPTIRRGTSSGDIWTPVGFIAAIEQRFGPLAVDLAASDTNHKAPFWITEAENSFTVPWSSLCIQEVVVNAVKKSQLLLCSLADEGHQMAEPSHLGAESVLEHTPRLDSSSVELTQSSRSKSKRKKFDISNPQKVENGSAADPKLTTLNEGSGILSCRGAGIKDSGGSVRGGGNSLVPIAAAQVTLHRTISSPLPILPVPVQFPQTLCPHAAHATVLKEIDLPTHGAKMSQSSGELKHTCKPLMFLNPPYSNIAPWAEKCAVEWDNGAEILLLVPASIGSNWFWRHVYPYATVYSVGRMVFDNCFDRNGKLVTTPYPKDLILAHYIPGMLGHLPLHRWNWKER